MGATPGDAGGDRGDGFDQWFKRGGRAALLAYAAGLVVHTTYVVTTNLAFLVRAITEDPIRFARYAVYSYQGSHVGVGLYRPGVLSGTYVQMVLADPLPLLVPAGVLLAAGWYVADRNPGRPTQNRRRGIAAGAVAAYGGVTVLIGVYEPGSSLQRLSFWWNVAVVGLVYPVVFTGLGVWLSETNEEQSGTTNRSLPGRETGEAVEVGSTVPHASELACPECGERAGRGTFCPHCGADL